MKSENAQQVALVTGSGSGIGRAIAIALAHDGYRVILNSRSASPTITDSGAYEVKARIEEAGGQADVIRGDVGSSDDRASMLQAIDERHGRLDLLVNNAGVAPKQRVHMLDLVEENFDWLLHINLRGPFFLTQQIAKRMVAWKKDGTCPNPRIAFITSISAYASSIHRAEYCISKTGLSMAARLYADCLGEWQIPVIEVRPGIIDTPMIAKVREDYVKRIEDGLLVTRRIGKPEDVAAVVTAFGRGDLDYCTGESIEVSGGFGLPRLNPPNL